MKSKYRLSRCALAVAGLLLPAVGLTAGFAAGVSPSKFELEAKPGEVLRDTVTILNPSDEMAEFQLSTAEWRLNDESGVEFLEDQLVDGSCRPWVRLERKTVQVRAGEQKNYRFEVHVPADAAPRLCQFAILIESSEAADVRIANDQISLPIVGRYAVITYVAVGDAQAAIDYLGMGTALVRDQRLPTLRLQNTGNNYDRAFGQVTATDARGSRAVLIPSTFPILPGRTEEILLSPETNATGAAPVALSYPLTLKGQIEVGGETIRIDEILE